MPRSDLPPPPPPPHLRAWVDESAVRVDRGRYLAELSGVVLGYGRLLLLWLVAAVFVLGWGCLALAWPAFERGGVSETVVGVVFTLLGVGVLVPASLWLRWGARRDRQARRLLAQWAEAETGPDGTGPAVDPALRDPVRGAVWLATSALWCAIGLSVTFVAAGTARPGQATYGEVGFWIGLGLILWVTGLTGLGKAVAHHRWAARLARAGGPAAGAGVTASVPAPRSAPSGPPPPA
ncbi:hypothetical protein ACN20G_09125 [Streptomyces sp. BI20]|uniref:hypothetical protein n=1 Tax=Streptomyces sp. BI20 TaxID=3403460 RepID=UPI003C7162A9